MATKHPIYWRSKNKLGMFDKDNPNKIDPHATTTYASLNKAKQESRSRQVGVLGQGSLVVIHE